MKTNYKTPFGEAAIGARVGETVASWEARARLSEAYGTPAEAVEAHKRRRYADIARWFIMKAGCEPYIRFDVVEVSERGVNHIPAAFEP